jgi:hypothetical protein
MKLLWSRRYWIAAGIAALVVLGVVLSAFSARQPANQYRHCGHRPETRARLLAFFPFWQWVRGTDRLASYVTIHGCSGDRARGVLEKVAFMQSEFKTRFGQPANTLSELCAAKLEGWPHDEQSLTSGFQVQYHASAEDWSAYIPKQADLPGHYLALSKGVFFCETHRPTTNDYPLSFFK